MSRVKKSTYKLGDFVALKDVGCSYSSLPVIEVVTYIQRYKPINARCKKIGVDHYTVNIETGYGTDEALHNLDLKWKVRCIFKVNNKYICDNHYYYYIISSNKNHMIVIGARGLKKIKQETI